MSNLSSMSIFRFPTIATSTSALVVAFMISGFAPKADQSPLEFSLASIAPSGAEEQLSARSDMSKDMDQMDDRKTDDMNKMSDDMADGMVDKMSSDMKDGGSSYAELIVAGGCFWCVEKDFEKVVGVIEAKSGYTGGRTDNPNYKGVSKGGTGHYEAVKIAYNPKKVSYKQLIDFFWRTVDVTDAGGQFCDRGESYRTAVFVTKDQKNIAAHSKSEAQKSLGKTIVTPILDVQDFYDAEKYHQDYYKKNPVRYGYYRSRCGRDKAVKRLWKDEAGGKQFITLKKKK